jgi:hypothetical protein
VVLPEGHRLARRDAVSLTDLETEPLVLPRRDTPAGRFRSVVEHLCAQAGSAHPSGRAASRAHGGRRACVRVETVSWRI